MKYLLNKIDKEESKALHEHKNVKYLALSILEFVIEGIFFWEVGQIIGVLILFITKKK